MIRTFLLFQTVQKCCLHWLVSCCLAYWLRLWFIHLFFPFIGFCCKLFLVVETMFSWKMWRRWVVGLLPDWRSCSNIDTLAHGHWTDMAVHDGYGLNCSLSFHWTVTVEERRRDQIQTKRERSVCDWPDNLIGFDRCWFDCFRIDVVLTVFLKI